MLLLCAASRKTWPHGYLSLRSNAGWAAILDSRWEIPDPEAFGALSRYTGSWHGAPALAQGPVESPLAGQRSRAATALFLVGHGANQFHLNPDRSARVS